jgi:pimeloyl-ACP methyl ester carboxylesterase
VLHRLLNTLILLPDRYCYQVPADLGLCADAVAFPNAQGQLLHGFWFKPVGRTAPLEIPQDEAPVVLFCPGTSGNLSSHLYYVELLCRAGCAVLSVDYTGFGQSAGQASLHTLVPDILCASNFLCRAKHVQAFGIFGMSLGANLALLIASQRQEVRAVAVEGLALYGEITRGVLADGIMGPRDVTTVTYENRPPVLRRHHVLNQWRVGGWLAKTLAWAGMTCFPFAGKDPRAPARLLTDTPVLCMHGVDDPLLPFEGTLQVYNALPGAKQLWLIPEVSHPQEAALAQDGEYVAQLARFFHTTLQGQAHVATPCITSQLVPQGSENYILYLHNAGAPGLVLTTVVSEHDLACRTVWVKHDAEISVHAPGRLPTVSCLPLCEVDGDGDRAHIRYTPRGQQYQTIFRPLIRELSQMLHERRLHDLEALLHTLPHKRPEPPFDFFLGLYCAQIIQRTRQKMPSLARVAAQVFTRYWHYGPDAASPGQPTLWALAAEVLGQRVRQHRRTHAGR